MTALETMSQITLLRQAGKFDLAASYYAVDAALVIEPKNRLYGRKNIRGGLVALSLVIPTFEITAREIVVTKGVALHHAKWQAKVYNAYGEFIYHKGQTSDVLLQQDDGNWLVAIDNPWSSHIIDDVIG